MTMELRILGWLQGLMLGLILAAPLLSPAYMPWGVQMLFALSAFQLARRCSDPFGRYLVAGCAFLVYGQALINMGGVMAALPLTGVPLPFISYGRNNLLMMMMAVGVIMSVARWGPVAESSAGTISSSKSVLESADVTYLDSGRGYGGARSARAGRR